jgi:hypothetical protein
MLFLFLILPFWGLELLAPVFLWIMSDPRWHPLLAMLYGACAFIVAVLWSRGVLRDLAEHRRHPVVRATWRWRRDNDAEQYRVRLDMFLRLRGWRVATSCVNQSGRVEIIARKDRYTVVLLCAGPGQSPPGQHDLARLATLRTEVRASHAALVSTRPFIPHAEENVRLLRFTDLARIESAVGMGV